MSPNPSPALPEHRGGRSSVAEHRGRSGVDEDAALASLLTRPDLWRGTPAASASATALPTGHAALDALLPGGGWPLGALTEVCYAQDGIGELRVLMPALAQLTRAQRWIALVAAPHPLYAPALAAAGLELARVVLVTPEKEKRGSEYLSHGKGRADSVFSARERYSDPLLDPLLSARERGSDPLFSDSLLWAAEQALRSGACGAVLLWPRTIDDRGLRRLQLAAEAGRNWCVALRPLAAAAHASPAALRLQIESGPRVRVLKCRGATRVEKGGQSTFLAGSGVSIPFSPHEKGTLTPFFYASRQTHVVARARISAPGTGCPR